MISIFKNRLFGKLFILIYLAIILILTLFTLQVIDYQKKSILESLSSQGKGLAHSISYLKRDDMIIDNQIAILEFILEYMNQNDFIKTFIVSRENGSSILIQKDKWSLLEKHNPYTYSQINKITYEIIYSQYTGGKVFKYSYPVVISGIPWGWLHIELSLAEYDKKIEQMYDNLILLAIVLLLTAIFLSYLIATMITKPIIKLNNISQKITQGDLTLRTGIKTNDEIGILARTFDNMLQSLEKSQNDLKKSQLTLEKRVEERTFELKQVNKSLEEKTNELAELNENLEHRVFNEISKRQKQEQLLIQQSKLAAMGEMIGNIAHQWRQPLNALSLVLQNIDFTYKMGDLDDEFMDKSIKKANLLTLNMSKTIDDFRNFFRPNKEKKEFILEDMVNQAITMVDSSLHNNDIKIVKKNNGLVKVFGFPNEFSQVILNIINNAKDALIDSKTEDKKIELDIFSDDKFAYISILDNAGGIPIDIIEKIYDPYFTTKEEGKGTGIGLYMSKTIIEENMQGKLKVENVENGAKFTIKIPLSGVEQ